MNAQTIKKKNVKGRERGGGGRERDVHGWFSPFTVISVHLGHLVFLYALEPHAIFMTSVLYSHA